MFYFRILLLFVFSFLSNLAFSQNSIGLRNNGKGNFNAKNVVQKWDSKQNILWKAELAASSFSSPIVVGDKIFATCEPSWLYCLDLNSGKVLWKKSHTPQDLPEEIRSKAKTTKLESGNSAPTPVSDGKQVFATFADSVIVAYSLDGKQSWVIALDIAPLSSDGRSASPIIADGKLIVNMETYFAIDPANGKIIWKTEGEEESYGSPIATEVEGIKILITPKGSIIDLKNGKHLLKELAEMSYVTPYLSGGNSVFYIDEAMMAYKLVKKDGTIHAEELWIDALDGDFYASPVLIDGIFYTVNDSAEVFAIKQSTGEIVYQQELNIPPVVKVENKGDMKVDTYEIHMYPSPIVLNDNVLVSNNIGDFVLIKPGEEFELLNQNSLKQGSGGTPFIANNNIIIRCGNFIYCIGKE